MPASVCVYGGQCLYVWVQGSQGAGHLEAAHLESSGMSWKLPFLGAVGSIEEQGIRIPPLSPGCCFNDEYEVLLSHLLKA